MMKEEEDRLADGTLEIQQELYSSDDEVEDCSIEDKSLYDGGGSDGDDDDDDDDDDDIIDFSELDKYLSENYMIFLNAVLTFDGLYNQSKCVVSSSSYNDECKNNTKFSNENLADKVGIHKTANWIVRKYYHDIFKYCIEIYDYLKYRRKKIIKIPMDKNNMINDTTSKIHIISELACLLVIGAHCSHRDNFINTTAMDDGKKRKNPNTFLTLEYQNEYQYVRQNIKMENDLYDLLISKVDMHF